MAPSPPSHGSRSRSPPPQPSSLDRQDRPRSRSPIPRTDGSRIDKNRPRHRERELDRPRENFRPRENDYPRYSDYDRDSDRRRRDHDRPPRHSTGGGSSGFRWKSKARTPSPPSSSQNLERGYRQQNDSRKQDDYQERSRHARGQAPTPRAQASARTSEPAPAEEGSKPETPRQEKKERKEKPAPAPAPAGEAMIIVNVNDRLGTKASIPCLASDPIKLFKAQVAARIGREPHEIMLKRQGERPFKDGLTLEDYGVSNGVQLDL
ncbi:hypothetical protein MMC12_004338 [Toensbergia leucococca]|nr:hypothetical protein [Toensbergia leucococca]